MKPFNPTPRPCPVCAKTYIPARPMQAVCGPRCAHRKIKQDKADERAKVVAALTSCVDTHEAASSLFFGKGRISAKAAECVADVLDKAGMVPIFFEAWINAKPVDPFANDGNLANTMSAAAQVCLSPGELNWPTLRSPVDDQDLIDSDLPAGSRDSNHPDDRRLREEESN